MRILPPPPQHTHKDCCNIVRHHIYTINYLLVSFQRENEIGGGSSLIYSPEIVATIRQLYPGDIKDYPPQSRKVSKNLPLLQFLQNRFFSCSFLLSTCSVKCCMKSPWRSWWRCTTRKTSVIQ